MSRGLVVGLLGNQEFTKELGKKSTESDIALYSFKEGDVLVSVLVPVRYPEKPQPLAYTVANIEGAVVVVNGLSRQLGEQILALDAAGVERGVFVLQNFVQPEQIQPLIKDTALAHYAFMDDSKPPAVRSAVAKMAQKPKEGPVRVPVDHHFDVKGIGTVLLGFVKQGSLKKHDELRVYPTDKKAQVRSIQVHDVDVAEAHPGDHVGAALKGVAHEDLDRGYVLAPEATMSVAEAGKTVKLDLGVSKFYKGGVKPEGVYHLALGMQFVNVRAKGALAEGQTGVVEFEVQKPFAYNPLERGVLFNLDNPNQRVVGRAIVQH